VVGWEEAGWAGMVGGRGGVLWAGALRGHEEAAWEGAVREPFGLPSG